MEAICTVKQCESIRHVTRQYRTGRLMYARRERSLYLHNYRYGAHAPPTADMICIFYSLSIIACAYPPARCVSLTVPQGLFVTGTRAWTLDCNFNGELLYAPHHSGVTCMII